jgi:hypothetical protein
MYTSSSSRRRDMEEMNEKAFYWVAMISTSPPWLREVG